MVRPRIESLDLADTTESTALVKTTINFTNPSPYAATVPFVDLALFYNGTVVGRVVGKNVSIVPGVNRGIYAELMWSPLDSGGLEGVVAGRQMISSYVSGKEGKERVDYRALTCPGCNTTVTIRSDRRTIPTLPNLGLAMSKLQLHVPVPKIPSPPDDGDDDDDDNDDDGEGRTRFIRDATVCRDVYFYKAKQLT